ncbi:MAG: hypothetical protein CMI90_01305 [Pelagibacteraceae bacterium]|nr:hypothetical protein [Pelagibacteraceae bacterium]|tara:strand:- start:1533 stop:1748 length:216 start_codon:yes stop_codon:yes gene_type:complete
MVEQKPEEVSSSLKDNFLLILLSFLFISSCENSFKNFDDKLIDHQLELEEFTDKSNLRKEEIVETIDEKQS